MCSWDSAIRLAFFVWGENGGELKQNMLILYRTIRAPAPKQNIFSQTSEMGKFMNKVYEGRSKSRSTHPLFTIWRILLIGGKIEENA